MHWISLFLTINTFPNQVNILMHTADIKITPERLNKIKMLKEKQAAQDQKELFGILDASDKEAMMKKSNSNGNITTELHGISPSADGCNAFEEKSDSLSIQSGSVDILSSNVRCTSNVSLGTDNENKMVQNDPDFVLPTENSDIDGKLGIEKSDRRKRGGESSDELDSKLGSTSYELPIDTTDMNKENENHPGELENISFGVICYITMYIM